MKIEVNKDNLENISAVLYTLYDWSGISDDTPDDTEVVEFNGSVISVGQLRDTITTVNNMLDSLSEGP